MGQGVHRHLPWSRCIAADDVWVWKVLSISGVCAQALTGMFASHSGDIDDRWVRFMKFQIARARAYFADAQAGVDALNQDARWPVWSALILYRLPSSR